MTTTTDSGAERVHTKQPWGNETEEILDVFGVGFGPANLSLAFAIEEGNAQLPPERRITARFTEAQPRFGWHDGMLLPGTTMQISFLKDLVTLRNPTSTHSFLSYLQEKGRLSDFINMKTFFPTRREFHDYLRWAAARVTLPVDYATRATLIEWRDGHFAVAVEGRAEPFLARNVVVATGIRAVLPEGIAAGPRVFHNHRLLDHLADLPARSLGRFLVVGSGQSAAEVAAYLHDTYPAAEVHASFRRFGYTPSDDTPFANRIFDPAAVDEFYTAAPALKERLMGYHWLTNYSAVDADLIEELYRREYDESVQGESRFVVHRVTGIDALREEADGVTVTLRDLGDRGEETLEVDAAVFATGFVPNDVRELLGASIDCAEAYDGDLPIVERDYRLHLPDVDGSLFLNGGVQHSHGLTSSLLSNLAVRAGEIFAAVTEDRAAPVH